MSESRKEKIISNLKQARQAGQLKTENIRDIVKTAISEAASEVQEGRAEIGVLVRDAIAAVVEIFQDKKGEIQEEVTASIEGAVEGISDARRKTINSTQSEIKTLEAKVVVEEEKLQKEIDGVLEELQTENSDKSTQVKKAIFSAIDTIKNSEEVALLQKRYAQLKAQLAIVQANLAGRYGEDTVNVNHYLEEAKTWYEKARKNPEVFTGKIEEKQQEFEKKLGEAGVAIAKRERKIKKLLRELWQSISEIFTDK